jgi:membrane protein implicated in regulation of membrane protease activity
MPLSIPPRYLPYLVVTALVLLVFLVMLVRRARRRWREGKQAVDELRSQSRAMHLEQQGMATSAAETTARRKGS